MIEISVLSREEDWFKGNFGFPGIVFGGCGTSGVMKCSSNEVAGIGWGQTMVKEAGIIFGYPI